MAENIKKKCHICIGCGRCGLPAEEALHVVTESFLKSNRLRRRNNLAQGDGVVAVDKDSGPVAEEAMLKGDFVVVDIGTTTIAMELYDADGKKVAEYVCPNPQRIFGADVISRIQAAENPMNAGQMRAQVIFALSEGMKALMNGVQQVEKLYIVGNTTMLYLLMGHDTQPLGHAPFQADFLQSETFSIGENQLVTLPGLSAFIGADVLAGILACGIHEEEEISLLIDLGTNGEMVLGNRERMLACSTAAGPVFDGLCDKDGQIVWGADLVHLVAKLIENGIVDETGLLADAYFESGIDIGGVHITQENIRNLQTAKAAIATGIAYLLQEYGVSTEKVNKVYLAGGFGYFLQEEDAVRIGLLPGGFQGKVLSAGNTALVGAYDYRMLKDKEEVTKQITEAVQTRNLAQWECFNDLFVQNMDFLGN